MDNGSAKIHGPKVQYSVLKKHRNRPKESYFVVVKIAYVNQTNANKRVVNWYHPQSSNLSVGVRNKKSPERVN